jgi:hypothetical protein
MGQSTEELTSQIEQTRSRMSSDVDALQDRVSPSAIVERRKQAARSKASSVKDRVMGVAHGAADHAPSASGVASGVSDTAGTAVSATQERVQGSPLGAGLVAFGAGLVVASLLPASKAEAEAAHQALENAQPLMDDVRDDVMSSAQQVAADAKDQAASAAQQVKESATEATTSLKDEARSSAESVRSDAQS